MELPRDLQWIVRIAGILIIASTFPQMLHTLRTGLTRDIDLYLLIFAIVGIGLYVYYAYRTGQRAFAIADGVDCAMWCVVLAVKINNIMNGTDAL